MTVMDFFDIRLPFTLEGSGSNAQIEVGNQWTNARMDGSVIVNAETTEYNGQFVSSYDIQLPGGNTYDFFGKFNQLRAGAGIEIAGSQNDDYIDLSSLSKSDFNSSLNWYNYVDFEISPGNDIWKAPDFTVSFTTPKAPLKGFMLGIIDGSDYHRPYTPWYETINP